MSSRNNLPLIAGIFIPVLMIIFVVISIYVPAILAPKPRYNFLYSLNDGYGQYIQYGLENAKLVKYEAKVQQGYERAPAKLYVYDLSTNTENEITFEDARELLFYPGEKSPDGYEIVYGSDDDFFPFSRGGSYNSLYLKGHATSKKLNISSTNEGRYYRNRRFIAWIKNP